MDKEYINFGVHLKRHIIDEDNNYRVEYETMHGNIDKTYKGTFDDYFKESSILKRMGIQGDYEIYLDMNQHHSVSGSCQMIAVLEDDALMRNTNDTPYRNGNDHTRYLHIAPEEEKWVKYVLLDEKQIEEAKKIMSDIEKQPFLKKRKLND